MRGTGGEEAPETAAQHLAVMWPPGTLRRPSMGRGGASQCDASCHPSATRCASRSPAQNRPHPLSPAPPPFPPGSAQHLLPVQSQFDSAPRTPRSPGDMWPRHPWHPNPLMTFPTPTGPQMSPNGARSPLWHRGAVAQSQAQHPAALAVRGDPAERDRGCGIPPSQPALPTLLLLPRILLDAACPGQGAAHRPAPGNSWVGLKSKTGLAAGRENSLSPPK